MGRAAFIASKLDLGLAIVRPRSGGTIIDAEGESEEKPRTEDILHRHFEHALPQCRLQRPLAADPPEQTASREKYEKHHEQQLDEHGGKTSQPDESEIRRNNGQNQKRGRPTKHGKPRIFAAKNVYGKVKFRRAGVYPQT